MKKWLLSFGVVVAFLTGALRAQDITGIWQGTMSAPGRDVRLQFRVTSDAGGLKVNSNIAIRDMLTGQLLSGLLDGLLVVVYFLILFWFSHVFGAVAQFLLPILMKRNESVPDTVEAKAAHYRALRADRHAQCGEPVEHGAVRLRTRRAPQLAKPVGEE